MGAFVGPKGIKLYIITHNDFNTQQVQIVQHICHPCVSSSSIYNFNFFLQFNQLFTNSTEKKCGRIPN